MASEWAKSEREGWLCQLYGIDQDDGTRILPPDSIQSRMVDVLERVMSLDVSPKEGAAQTASLIMEQEDVDTPWNNHLGLHLHAAEVFDDEKVLEALVEYLIELASLPDAIHDGPDSRTFQTSYGTVQIEPGQPIETEDGRLWRDLPGYPINLTERLQGEYTRSRTLILLNLTRLGPEQYRKIHGGHKEPLEAMQTWSNINTYVALMAVHPRAKTIPVLAHHARRGLITLAVRTEYSSGTWLGRNAGLHAPAAVQWLRIAGSEIERLCEAGTEQVFAGDLWQSRGGTDVCDSARLAFWKARLNELDYL